MPKRKLPRRPGEISTPGAVPVKVARQERAPSPSAPEIGGARPLKGGAARARVPAKERKKRIGKFSDERRKKEVQKQFQSGTRSGAAYKVGNRGCDYFW